MKKIQRADEMLLSSITGVRLVRGQDSPPSPAGGKRTGHTLLLRTGVWGVPPPLQGGGACAPSEGVWACLNREG